MHRLLPLLLLAFTLFSPLALHAQRIVWGTTSSEGEYLLSIEEMVSVSMHTYIVDGAAKITEVNIATKSPVLVRYYHIDIITPETPAAIGQSVVNKVTEMAKEAAGRTNLPIDNKVIKNYPTTTHARTIEYRVSSAEGLKKIYDSAKQSFLYRKGDLVKIE